MADFYLVPQGTSWCIKCGMVDAALNKYLIMKLKLSIFFIYNHLKLEIVSAIPASNERKIVTNNSAGDGDQGTNCTAPQATLDS